MQLLIKLKFSCHHGMSILFKTIQKINIQMVEIIYVIIVKNVPFFHELQLVCYHVHIP